MRRFLSLGFLLLFLFSTAATYASVHLCEGKVTDVAIISAASCDHEENKDLSAQDHCSEKHNEAKHKTKDHACCNENPDEGCCDNEELTAVKNVLTKVAGSNNQIVFKTLSAQNHFFLDSFTTTSEYGNYFYRAPFLIKDIAVVVQCFRI